MMKIILIILSALLFSCTAGEEDPILSNPVEARISVALSNEAATRAATEVTTFPDGAQIGITGLFQRVDGANDSITNKPYTYALSDGQWSSDDPFYYQNANTVTFSAYYPYDPLQYRTTDGSLQLLDAADYLYTTVASQGSVSDNNVTLALSHVMTKLSVTFTNAKDNGSTASEIAAIEQFQLYGPYTRGTFNTSTGVANGTATLDYLEIPTDASTLTTNSGTASLTGSTILFPQTTPEDIYILVKVGDIYYRSQLKPSASDGNLLRANTVYNFTVKVYKSELVVSNESTSITDWETVEETIDSNNSGSGDNSSSSGNNSGSGNGSTGDGNTGTDNSTTSTATLYALALSDGTFISLSDGNGGLASTYATTIANLTDTQKAAVQGIVYYLGDTGLTGTTGTAYSHGLMVALKDVNGTNDMTYQWQTVTNLSTGTTTGQALGDGYTNTIALEKYNSANTTYPCLPVKALTDKAWSTTDATVASRWFIPSVKELEALYATVVNVNKVLTALGGKPLETSGSSACYWTSTESSKKQAYYVYFNTASSDSSVGTGKAKDKTNTYYVRPVSAF